MMSQFYFKFYDKTKRVKVLKFKFQPCLLEAPKSVITLSHNCRAGQDPRYRQYFICKSTTRRLCLVTKLKSNNKACNLILIIY